MGLISVAGKGPLYPYYPIHSTPISTNTSVGPIDATGEKAAFVGRVWFPGRTGTKDIRYVCFRFGTVVKTGGSALTVSLQDVSLTAGPPIQPDETQDQTVAIANANAAFATGAWIKTAALSADRTVTFGDLLAVVVEYDGSGCQTGDSFYLSCSGIGGGTTFTPLECTGVQKVGAPAWATANVLPNVILEFSDGTFGTLDGALPFSTHSTASSIASDSSPDEYANIFQVPFPCKIDGLWMAVNPSAATANMTLALLSGAGVVASVDLDANALRQSAVSWVLVPIAEQTLAPNTNYYLSIKPTVAGSPGRISVYYIDVADANHFSVHDGGTSIGYTTRTDGGSWAATTTTRRLLGGVRISALNDSTSAGGGLLINPGLSGGLR